MLLVSGTCAENGMLIMALAGDDQGVYAALAAFAKDILHIDVELVESDNPTWGGACSYDPEGRPARIVVASNRSPLFRAQTLAHELAYALLHSDKDYRALTPRSRIECEAESVSFCIMHHFGLDVGEVAFDYLAHWGDGKMPAVVQGLQNGKVLGCHAVATRTQHFSKTGNTAHVSTTYCQ